SCSRPQRRPAWPRSGRTGLQRWKPAASRSKSFAARCPVAEMTPTLEAHRAIVDRLPLVSYMVQLELPSRAVFVSPQIEALFGFSVDDFEAADFWERRIAAEDRPGFLAAFDELRTSHGRMSVEYRVKAADGREV